MKKATQKIKDRSGALLGQALNFLAMLLPILGSETKQLAYLMVPLALGTVLGRSSLLAFHANYLTIPSQLHRISTTTSFISLAATSSAVAFLGFLVFSILDATTWATILWWTAYLTITNGIYFMSVAIVTQEQKMVVYSKARLLYGTLNVGLTAMVVFAIPTKPGLVIVAGATTLLGSIYILCNTENSVIGNVREDWKKLFNRDHRTYFRASRGATLSTLLSELGFQLQGLMTPLFGPYQEIWAVVVRISGGFGSLAQQVIAPEIEAKIARSIRSKDYATTKKLCVVALAGGFSFSIICSLALVGSLFFSLKGAEELTATVIVLAALYCIAVLGTSLSLKIPLMKARQREYMLLSVFRLIALGSLFFTTGLAVFFGITILQCLLSALSATISLSQSKR